MGLGHQTIDIGASSTDAERAVPGDDPETLWRLTRCARYGSVPRDDAAPDDIDRLRAPAPFDDLPELGQVGIGDRPPLLSDHTRVVLPRVERHSRLIGSHVLS